MEGYLAEIRGFAGNFAPRAWAFCSGQLLSIAQNQALFSLLGTTYGGDGRTTFALPDLRGRAPISAGQGPGLSNHNLGSRSGTETVTLTASQMPSHYHVAATTNPMAVITSMTAKDGAATTDTPAAGLSLAKGNTEVNFAATPTNMYGSTGNNVVLSSGSSQIPAGQSVTVGATGGSQWHTNMQPYLTIYWIICMQGLFPSRN
ncbi:hypothetical protein AWW67_15355 [Roseivirga seohaensis]|uniref:Phage tail collar domain-containing protein n=2 Tax=Roseivirga seohaensis TaxID=1914963 RepID=A0A0L8ANP3_9BACT|nr:tail fiber protein [Roseivirga seohaensis]KOF03886.1 hypothetical protein OB69_02390 [Roseivirga seohaensis subsp. aquiponti]KYG85369.1 hypothetical protein AWW67_15355 [Roseivirga seohaensis]